MTRRFSVTDAELDRLRELAHIGASWAANAFGQLAGRAILTRVPVVYGPEHFQRRSDWNTGIFFEATGAVNAAVAIFLPAATRDAMVKRLLKEEEATMEARASALCEFGNILASQTVSAVADTLGARILLGLPELVMENAEAALEAWLAPRYRTPPPLYIESELFDRQGTFRALHAFLPEVLKRDPSAR